jgi:hypothetical protein
MEQWIAIARQAVRQKNETISQKNETIIYLGNCNKSLIQENSRLKTALQAQSQKGVVDEEALLHELQVEPGPGPADGADKAADADAALQEEFTSWQCWQMQEGGSR